MSDKFRLAGLGVGLAAAVAGGCLIGWYIDHRFETRYGLLTGAILGILGGLYNLINQSLRIIHDEQKRSSVSKNDLDRGD